MSLEGIIMIKVYSVKFSTSRLLVVDLVLIGTMEPDSPDLSTGISALRVEAHNVHTVKHSV